MPPPPSLQVIKLNLTSPPSLQVIKLNLTSCFNILRSSVKRMMTSGGGSVVFCSSAVARHGIPNHEAIAAAKAGVVGEFYGEGRNLR